MTWTDLLWSVFVFFLVGVFIYFPLVSLVCPSYYNMTLGQILLNSGFNSCLYFVGLCGWKFLKHKELV
jgi:hypothetical protein